MQNQNTQLEDDQDMQALGQARQAIMDAHDVYEAVISQLNIPHDDALFHDIVYGILRRQSKDHMVFSIWNNITKEQDRHLRDFIDQSMVTNPLASSDDLLIEFALMYPKLMDKVYESLSAFFKSFIAKFNEILEA